MKTENFLNTSLTIHIDQNTKQSLIALAKLKGYPMSLYLREIIRNEINQNQNILNMKKSIIPIEKPLRIKCTVATTVSENNYRKIKQAAIEAELSISEFLRQKLEITNS